MLFLRQRHRVVISMLAQMNNNPRMPNHGGTQVTRTYQRAGTIFRSKIELASGTRGALSALKSVPCLKMALLWPHQNNHKIKQNFSYMHVTLLYWRAERMAVVEKYIGRKYYVLLVCMLFM